MTQRNIALIMAFIKDVGNVQKKGKRDGNS